MLLRQSQAPHFVYQAAGLLDGRLSIPGEPPNLNDWVLHEGRWYSSFPMFPAVLMAPFVALHGLAFNDVFFTVCMASLAAGLMAAFLKALRDEGQHDRPDLEIAGLTALFVFGTVFFYSAIRGEVWFTAHVVGACLALAYLLASLRARSPVLAGLALGCAVATRASMVYAAPFFLVEVLNAGGGWPERGAWKGRVASAMPSVLRFAVAFAAVVGLHLWANHARFGSWTEFGHTMLHANRVNERIRAYGLFHPHYFPDNVRSALLRLPVVQWQPFRIGFDGNGMSMLLTTPVLAYALAPRPGAGSRAGLALTALCVALPGLFYMNNGWYQFGYRFSNDFLPFAFGLIAIGARARGPVFWGLGVVGLVVSGWGAAVFGR
jgi:hypothetical protein